MLRAAHIESEDETFTYAGPCLEYELEHCLLFGKGSSGQLVIRHQEVFAREWQQWRGVILPKFIDAFPGHRPAAAYITGELPLRPVEIEIPADHPARDRRRLYVIEDERNGFWYCDWPEPFQRDETAWLYEIEAIGKAEYLAGRRRTREQGLRLYEWQHGVEA